MKDKQVSDKVSGILVFKIYEARASNEDVADCNRMGKSMEMRITFKRVQLKSLSSRNILSMFTNVTGRHW